MQKSRLLLQQGLFIEIKFEILQVYYLMGGRYFHVINYDTTCHRGDVPGTEINPPRLGALQGIRCGFAMNS